MSQATTAHLESPRRFRRLRRLQTTISRSSANRRQDDWIVFGCLMVAVVLAYVNMIRFTATLLGEGHVLARVHCAAVRRLSVLDSPATPGQRRAASSAGSASAWSRRRCCFAFTPRTTTTTSSSGSASSAPCSACCLIVGGKSMLRWAGPAVLFLLFMFPLPSLAGNDAADEAAELRLDHEHLCTLQTLGVGAGRGGQHDFDRHAQRTA